jgi:hypothetical protein
MIAPIRRERMNSKLTPSEHARRLARALKSTSDRYCDDLISRATWDRHMRHLWSIARAHGLELAVVKQLGIGRADR